MAWIKKAGPGNLPESEVTPEHHYLNRRQFLKELSRAGATASAMLFLPPLSSLARMGTMLNVSDPPSPEQPVTTPESIVTRYNNFYEFGVVKEKIWKYAERLKTDGWKIEVSGLVRKPLTLDAESLIRSLPVEERIYRLHCVEAWAAVIPWTGFSLRRLVERLEPLSSAKFVKFSSFLDPNVAQGQKTRFWEPWPYTEGLTMQEAMHDLAFMATGIYGHSLTPQNGAPMRLVVPWKHGFKSIKSITRIEFTRTVPDTFWTTVSPLEYDFQANVHPDIPYARWDQSHERIPGKPELVKTQPYNGYAAQVAHLYT